MSIVEAMLIDHICCGCKGFAINSHTAIRKVVEFVSGVFDLCKQERKMRSLKTALLVVIIGVASVFGSVAHGGALPTVGPNGGVLAESGEHHIELLVKGQTITVHLLDHDNNATNEPGVKGDATVVAGSFKERLELTSKPGGIFNATGNFPATGPLQVKVSLTPPGEAPLSAIFEVSR